MRTMVMVVIMIMVMIMIAVMVVVMMSHVNLLAFVEFRLRN